MSQRFTLTVNGKSHTIDADPDMPLLYALRDNLGLNNPHFGCGLAQCGVERRGVGVEVAECPGVIAIVEQPVPLQLAQHRVVQRPARRGGRR